MTVVMMLALDTFGADGLSNPRLDRVRPIADGDDGELDGWVVSVPGGFQRT